MATFFRSKGKGSHQLNTSGDTSYYIADVNELDGLVIGTHLVANAYVFDPRTGKVWQLAGSGTVAASGGNISSGGTQATPNQIANGTTTNSILRWNGTAWVEESDITVDSSGNVSTSGNITTTGSGAITSASTITAAAGITSTAGNITATAGAISAGTTVTAGTGITATTGNIVASAGAISANTTITAGTGITATTGDITASSGNLTVNGNADINGTANVAGTLTLDASTNNSLVMSGTGTNIIDLNGAGAQSIEMAGTTNTINLAGSGDAVISFTGSGSKKITGLDNPTLANDAANKAYVDAVASGLSVKKPARVATTGPLPGDPAYDNGTNGVGATLTATTNGSINSGTGIDHVNDLEVDDEILVKDQPTPAHNGKYKITSLGDSDNPYILTRVEPYDQASEITDGSFFFVQEGNINGNKGFVQTNTVTQIGSSAIIFQQFSSAGGGVSTVVTENGNAVSNGGSITITGSPSIDTSASGHTVTIALAADLTTGAQGFTIADQRIPFATAANILGSSAGLGFYNGTAHVLSVGNTTNSAIVLGASNINLVSTHGRNEPFNGVALPTNTNSAAIGVKSGNVDGSGVSGSAHFCSGSSSGAGTGNVEFYSGDVTHTGTGNSGSAALKSGNVQSGNSGNVTLKTGDSVSGNSGNVLIQTGTAGGGTRGTITLDANQNGVLLQNSPSDATTSGATAAVASVQYIRNSVIRKATGTTDISNFSAEAPAAKFLVYVKGSGAGERYASEIMAVTTDGGTGVDFSEINIVQGTMPAGLTISITANSGLVRISVSQSGNGEIVVEAIPLVV
jgi:hypothetical protein